MHPNINILIAPLDWGLGHATRSIPIIRDLQSHGFRVLLAADDAILSLLLEEFPGLEYILLPGYGVRYSEGNNLILSMAKQLPGILGIINYEHRWLDELLGKQKIDLVISDNRFGLWTKRTNAVIISHQINIQVPPALKWFSPVVSYYHHRYLRHFNEVWIPDWSGEPNLSGVLSSNSDRLNNLRFIGPLSRFAHSADSQLTNYEKDQDIDILAIISGPEPQRTDFAKIVIQQSVQSELRVTILLGTPGVGEENQYAGGRVKVFPHLKTSELRDLALRSKCILARAGYSTIMDLVYLRRPAIFVPTPGQTEQEYLAKYLSNKGWCFTQTQHEFNLIKAWENVRDVNPINIHQRSNESYMKHIKRLLNIN